MSAKIQTIEHIERVQSLVWDCITRLFKRAVDHDKSKLESPEAEIFEEYTHKLKGVTYGSEEYRQFLAEMKPALDHHYAANRHHPEHFGGGINEMTLLDLLEMFVDWKAASERHNDGCIYRSIEFNMMRFGLSEQLVRILRNTAAELWPDVKPTVTDSLSK